MAAMAYPFNGKVCLITGAASGIGRATAARMVSLGAQVAMTDLDQYNLLHAGSDTNQICRNAPSFLAERVAMISDFDVCSPLECNKFVAAIIEAYDRIDFVFNCAGVNPTTAPLTDTTDAYWDKLVNTNLRGTYNITRAAIPHLKAGGSIVNVSSVLGTIGSAGNAIYCATKWGVIGFTKSMALELGPQQIRVNAVAPGYIDTPTNASVLAGPTAVAEAVGKVAMGRMGTPEDVADVVAFLFSDEARYVNGSVVEVNGALR